MLRIFSMAVIILTVSACQSSKQQIPTLSSLDLPLEPISAPVKIQITEIPPTAMRQTVNKRIQIGRSVDQGILNYTGTVTVKAVGEEFEIQTHADRSTLNGKEQPYDVTITERVTSDGTVLASKTVDALAVEKELTAEEEATIERIAAKLNKALGNEEVDENAPAGAHPVPAGGFAPDFSRRVIRIAQLNTLPAQISLKGKVSYKGRPSLYFDLSGSGDTKNKTFPGTYSIEGYQIVDIATGATVVTEEKISIKIPAINMNRVSVERTELDSSQW